jgi:hypothetical protein
MAVFKTTCPDCGATLKSSNPMPPGKKVKCPKCGKAFTVAEDDGPGRGKSAARKAGAAAPGPDDDDEIGTYAVIKEPEDDKSRDEDDDDDYEDDDDEDRPKKEKKPDITFSLDTSVKDPRGPALIETVKPSNRLLLIGFINAVLYLLSICYFVFPLIFWPQEKWVDQSKVLGISHKEDELVPEKEFKDLKGEELAKMEEATGEFMVERLISAGVAFVMFLLCGLWIYGAVKMQNLESYAWSLIACIIAILVLLTFIGPGVFWVLGNMESDIFLLYATFEFAYSLQILVPIVCLRVLSDPKVREGFAYEAVERMKRGD